MEIRKLDEVIKANRLLTKENKSLLSYIGNIENKIGGIMRDFEIKNPSTPSQKEYMNSFWDFIIKEVPVRFSNKNDKYKLAEIKKVRKIKYYRDKLRELEKEKSNDVNSRVKETNG